MAHRARHALEVIELEARAVSSTLPRSHPTGVAAQAHRRRTPHRSRRSTTRHERPGRRLRIIDAARGCTALPLVIVRMAERQLVATMSFVSSSGCRRAQKVRPRGRQRLRCSRDTDRRARQPPPTPRAATAPCRSCDSDWSFALHSTTTKPPVHGRNRAVHTICTNLSAAWMQEFPVRIGRGA